MTTAEPHAWLEELSTEECLDLLRGTTFGRIAFVANAFPVVLPVNYRFVEGAGGEWRLAIRTRPGNVIDHASMNIGFEIDQVDRDAHSGWSVLVRGTLAHLDTAAGTSGLADSGPWVDEDRDSWLLIQPLFVRGRRLHRSPGEWTFSSHADL